MGSPPPPSKQEQQQEKEEEEEEAIQIPPVPRPPRLDPHHEIITMDTVNKNDDTDVVDINTVITPILQEATQSPIFSPWPSSSSIEPQPSPPLLQQQPSSSSQPQLDEFPTQGMPLSAVLQELQQQRQQPEQQQHGNSNNNATIRKNAHPGFFGYVCGPSLPTDPLSHAMVAALNQNVLSNMGAPAAVAMERTVLRWMRQLCGFPSQVQVNNKNNNVVAEGVIVSGGSIATLSALATALHASFSSLFTMAGGGRHLLLNHGLAAAISGGVAASLLLPVIVACRTAHVCVRRAAILLGLGAHQVLHVDHDDQFRMDPQHLIQVLDEEEEEEEEEDDHRCCKSQKKKKKRRHFVCVVGTAGTTLTGSIDPLDVIADICAERNIWFHVDAAYGGAALLSDQLKPRLRGLERADSVCMDLHKWFYLALDGSVLLYRNPEQAREVFSLEADYILPPPSVQQTTTTTHDDHVNFFDFSPELSRRFRGLPAYIAFRHYGKERLGKNIQHNHDCAVYLARLVEQAEDFELLNEPDLSICCFRYAPQHLVVNDEKPQQQLVVDNLNEHIRTQLEREGNFYMSSTKLLGRPVLRVCICSHTTRAEHMERLVESVRRLGLEYFEDGQR